MIEVWKDIDGFEGYKVSDKGRIIGLKKCILKPSIDRDGYLWVTLYKKGDKPKGIYIHRIVLSAFIPNIENKLTVNHIDGCKANNNIENLEWATHSENISHAYNKRLRVPYTEKDNLNKSKFAKEEIIDIKKMVFEGVQFKVIIEKYPISRATLSRIKSGLSWSNVI